MLRSLRYAISGAGLLLAAALVLPHAGLLAQATPPPFDVLITGGRIVDGTLSDPTWRSPAIASSPWAGWPDIRRGGQ
jgi:hypothetical protein